ncbi:unnamed protein product [Caenorhabditis auriculariae]|uniref:LIM interaction domain-containing protein n=1 Tax=Caenorhabditis auriculariae TaxID=2777116 RepID=A0A8S1HCZ4_9PELO|nr:unnamed protein product [Caenorhabditis auriculariae]
MPRRKTADGAQAAPKAPRVRKKKVNPEENKPPDNYEPLMQTNGYGMDDGGGMYTQDYGYAFGQQPPFASPEPNGSPYLLPPQSNTPQPQMMMRQMPPPPPPQPSSTPMGPAPSPLEFRVHEMNRRLYIFSNSGICEKDFAQWWDAFSHEFFDDDAKLWFLLFENPDSPDKYSVGRQLIPRFFRSIFESGMKELCFVLRGPTRETPMPSGCISFENDNVLQVTKLDAPMHTEVNVECKMYIEFTPYDEVLNHRIRSWTLEMRGCEEFFFNEMTKEFERIDPLIVERRITRMGFHKNTIGCLNLCKILEPMQVIMSNSKSTGNDPRDTMKRTIFHHYAFEMKRREMAMNQMNQQAMLPPVVEEKPKPQRKRTRKTPANNNKNKKTNASPAPTNPAFPPNPMAPNFSQIGYQDVMVVGEPSMMGGEFGEEDERTISRVENTQYDPNALPMRPMQMQPMVQQQMGGLGMGMVPQMGGPPGPMGPEYHAKYHAKYDAKHHAKQYAARLRIPTARSSLAKPTYKYDHDYGMKQKSNSASLALLSQCFAALQNLATRMIFILPCVIPILF